MHELLREIVIKHGRVTLGPSLGDDADLFAAGLDSFGMVDVMMVVEEECGVVFTSAALNRRSFASINTMAAVVAGLQAGAVPDAGPQLVSGRFAAQ